MGMQIEKSFVLQAPAGAVWEFLTDPARVARCLPGAAITGKPDEQTWTGTITVKVGPVTANYRGKLHFERLDPEAREAEIAASGQETRGKGGADMRMRSRVVERSPEETEVSVVSDVNVVGILAQFGRGMIQDVSDQLFQRFSEGMRRELEAAGQTAGAAPGAAQGATAGSPAPTAPDTAASAAPAAPTHPDAQAAPGAGGGGSAGAGGDGRPAAAGAQSPDAGRGLAGPAFGAPGSGAGSQAPASGGLAPAARPPDPPDASAFHTVPAGEALDLGSLGAAAASRALLRTLRRPGFWIALVLIVLTVLIIVRLVQR